MADFAHSAPAAAVTCIRAASERATSDALRFDPSLLTTIPTTSPRSSASAAGAPAIVTRGTNRSRGVGARPLESTPLAVPLPAARNRRSFESTPRVGLLLVGATLLPDRPRVESTPRAGGPPHGRTPLPVGSSRLPDPLVVGSTLRSDRRGELARSLTRRRSGALRAVDHLPHSVHRVASPRRAGFTARRPSARGRSWDQLVLAAPVGRGGNAGAARREPPA